MYLKETKELLEAISAYCKVKPEDIEVIEDAIDLDDSIIQTDIVTLIKKNNLELCVEGTEISISFENASVCFEEDAESKDASLPDYITLAKNFLIKLFTLPIRRIETYKGKALINDVYSFITPHGLEEFSDAIWLGHGRKFINPFAKKRTLASTWRYDKDKRCFACLKEWQPNPEAVYEEVIDEKRVEILKLFGKYTFKIWQFEYGDALDTYYWLLLNKKGADLFNTKESALDVAGLMLQKLSKK